ncbi:MAG: hypothetical protein VYD19_08270 [Myxococcota bacterium]|nr:hypothetical protein [Myxococcota bacterium]
MSKRRLLPPSLSTSALTLALSLLSSGAWALPQFALRSARDCATCHVDPEGWNDPEDVSQRKCTYDCMACHVSPSGAGMRNQGGIFYGNEVLPMFGPRQSEEYRASQEVIGAIGAAIDQGGQVPASQPAGMVPASQPAEMVPASQPAGMVPASQPAGMVPASQPAGLVPASQPVGMTPSSQPSWGSAPRYVAAPGTAGRYGGIEVNPEFQVGADVRLAFYIPTDTSYESPLRAGNETAIFPMQGDLYLAYRPYNPKQINQGRVTLLTTLGLQGSRSEGAASSASEIADRFLLREYYAMYHDLPNQMYVRAGRFLPAHGWRVDDHTQFTRRAGVWSDERLMVNRQVTGVEWGINPNYPYLHVSLFNPAPEWSAPLETGFGWGGAVSAGWRDHAWHGGASVVYNGRPENPTQLQADPRSDRVAYSIQWGANLYVLPLELPLIYLGELSVHQTFRGDLTPAEELTLSNGTGLAAFHELGWLITRGLNLKTRYDWFDTNTDFAFDTLHRATLAIEFFPYRYSEISLSYRHNWSDNENRFDLASDEVFLQIHGYY